MVSEKAMDDVQSWWEVPSIAHFCSLFRLYFDLLDFDIEEFEEALITDNVEDVGNSSLQDLIVRLLKGCFNSSKDEITTSNYQMYLRRLFRIKCEENSSQTNPFDRDVAFHSLPLRTKVEILHNLCDFRLDNDDVSESLKVLEAESLRVEPLGQDSGGSTYWYFYGTRLYREDYKVINTSTPFKKRVKKVGDRLQGAKWQVACFTEQDWQLLTRRFKNCKSIHERSLHRVLRDDFLPELPRLFAEKEKLQRKRMMSKFRRSGRNTNGNSSSTSPSAAMAAASPSTSTASATPRSVTEAIFSLAAARNGHEHANANTTGADTEDELRKQRLEQEKADRLLAEEMQREERNSRLHLRERRGGGMAFIAAAFPTSSCRSSHSSRTTKSNTTNDTSNTTGAKFSERDSGKSRRMTNNSLAACLPPMYEINNNEDEEEEDEGGENKSNEAEKKDRKEKESSERKSTSRSPSPAASSDSSTKKKKNAATDKVNSKQRKVATTKSVEGKENEVASTSVKKPVTKSLTNCLSGMSKTKVKSSIIFSQSEEDVQIGMHKVIEAMKNHRDAWPFVNPVDEDYAPNYYRIIDRPMDLQTIEDKLDNLEYPSVDEFTLDFQKIVDNCKKYNGPSSEYTEMVDTLSDAFQKSIKRYITPDDSDEEISIEYNNAPPERKRPRLSVLTKDDTIPEHVKENAPQEAKKSKSRTKVRGKGDRLKRDKKKRKMQLMRHHSRKSETMEALTSATAETLKDINKWLDDTPKSQSYSSSSPSPISLPVNSTIANTISSVSSPNIQPERTSSSNLKKQKNSSSSRSSSEKSHKGKGKSNHRQRHRDRSNESSGMPSKLVRADGKTKKKSKRRLKDHDRGQEGALKLREIFPSVERSQEREDSMEQDPERSRDRKEKHHHHHKHHKHHHHHHESGGSSGNAGSSHSTGSKDDIPNLQTQMPTKNRNKSHGSARKHGDAHRHKDAKRHSTNNSTIDINLEPIAVKSKPFEEKRPAAPRPRSLLLGLKNSHLKRFKGKLNSPHTLSAEAKNKMASVYDFPGSSNSSSKSTGGSSSDSPSMSSSKGESLSTVSTKDLLGEKVEKKKCLLVNDNPSAGEGGPCLSLGSVLSTSTTITLDKRESLLEEDTDDILVLIDNKNAANKESKSAESVEKVVKKEEDVDNTDSVNKEKQIETKHVEPAVIAATKKEEVPSEDEEADVDRKLEPTKGFNRDKCMPNLSAWIKAFGGPTKGSGNSGSPAPQPKLLEKHDKSKFKVMGRGVGESGSGGNSAECVTPTKSHHPGAFHSTRNFISSPTPPSPKTPSKPVAESLAWNQTNLTVNPATNPLATPVKIDSIAHNLTTALNMSRKEDSDGDHVPIHRHKKHRSRKRSTSSLSSQSESGSPCFNQDDGFSRSGRDSVVGGNNGVSSVNPPRWADDHWASQSQSPSASSQVSSQSPAGPNSPFSPPISSPPRTPQTPPRPTAPVRVGFYQDITSQNSSSPEKVNESNSNVPSPATPPTPTSHMGGASSSNTRRPNSSNSNPANHSSSSNSSSGSGKPTYAAYSTPTYVPRYGAGTPSPNLVTPGGPPSNGSNVAASPNSNGNGSAGSPSSVGVPSPRSSSNTPVNLNVLSVPDYRSGSLTSALSDSPAESPPNISAAHQQPITIRQPTPQMKATNLQHHHHQPSPIHPRNSSILSVTPYPNVSSYASLMDHGFVGGGASTPGPHSLSPHPEQAHSHSLPHHSSQSQGSPSRYAHNLTHAHLQTSLAHSGSISSGSANASVSSASFGHTQQPAHSRPVGGASTMLPASQPAPQPYPSNPYTSNPRNINVAPSVFSPIPPEVSARFLRPGTSSADMGLSMGIPMTTNSGGSGISSRSRGGRSSASSTEPSDSSRDLSVVNTVVSAAAAAAALEQKLGTDLNGFQWPHNLASLSQIVNSIPTPMGVGMASAYRSHFDQSVAAVENMTKFQRSDSGAYTSLNSTSVGVGASGGTSISLVTKPSSSATSTSHSSASSSSGSSSSTHGPGPSIGHISHPHATHSHSSSSSSSSAGSSNNNSTTSHSQSHSQGGDKSGNSEPAPTSSRRQSSSKSESKSSRSHGQSSNSKHSSSSSSSQGMVPGSAFNFSSLTPELALYSKEMSEASGLYSGSNPSLTPSLAHHHRPDIYPTSTGSFHPSFSVTSPRTTSGSVATPTLTPYQIPPFIGSHPSPYQPQSVSSQPFAHSQSPRGLPVDPYQQFFQGSPHVMGLLPTGYPAPYAHPHHSLGFNRPGWI